MEACPFLHNTSLGSGHSDRTEILNKVFLVEFKEGVDAVSWQFKTIAVFWVVITTKYC